MRYILTILSFVFITLLMMNAQHAGTGGGSKPVRLIHADSLTKVGEGYSTSRILEGNVHFVQGEVDLQSDMATEYTFANSALFVGNVVITQADLKLTSPKVHYFGNTETAKAYDGVVITDRNGRLQADSGLYSTRTLIADFTGHVKVNDDSVTIWADTVQHHRKTRVSYAYGNVVIEEDSVYIYADMVEHMRDERRSYAKGKVKIIDDSVVILADVVEHDRRERNSFAYGNVIIMGREDNAKLYADTVRNYTKKDYSLATGNPLLYQIDTLKKNNQEDDYTFDTLSIVSDTMEIFRGEAEKYIFHGNVKFIKGPVASISQYAVYDKKEEMITISGNPVIWYDSTQLYGDSIKIYAPGNKLENIKSYGSAFAAMREDTVNKDKITQLSGNTIEIIIKQDTIRDIYTVGNSKSLYFDYDEESTNGAKRDACDTINVYFDGGELNIIDWLSGVNGEFIPDALINNPKELYLPLFKWTDSKPDRAELDYKRKMREYLYIPMKDRINIFPDPADEEINIEMKDIEPGYYTIGAVNVYGDVVYEQLAYILGYKSLEKLNCSGFETGVYLIYIVYDKSYVYSKLIRVVR